MLSVAAAASQLPPAAVARVFQRGRVGVGFSEMGWGEERTLLWSYRCLSAASVDVSAVLCVGSASKIAAAAAAGGSSIWHCGMKETCVYVHLVQLQSS